MRTGEDTYRISLAVAGFKPDQISITAHQNTLFITGSVNEKQVETPNISTVASPGVRLNGVSTSPTMSK